MRAVIAPDSFKGSLTAEEVAVSIGRGLRAYDPSIDCQEIPLSDGGEGFSRLLCRAVGADWIEIDTTDALGRPIRAGFGIQPAKGTAFIDLAEASGLPRISQADRNPLKTSSFGTGLLMKAALERGAKRLILGLGGSATNDGGLGLAAALGIQFFNAEGRAFIPTGENLGSVKKINLENSMVSSAIEILVACDVDNPFHGKEGAAYVYAPQKGAGPEQVGFLDEQLRLLAQLVQRDLKTDLQATPGAGAAGGAGGGLVSLMGAQLVSGIELFLDEAGFDESLKDADLVITGEGRLDSQTLRGKVIAGVVQRAAKLRIPVAALCGGVLLGLEERKQFTGLHYLGDITERPMSLEEAMLNSAPRLERAAYDLISWALTFKK